MSSLWCSRKVDGRVELRRQAFDRGHGVPIAGRGEVSFNLYSLADNTAVLSLWLNWTTGHAYTVALAVKSSLSLLFQRRGPIAPFRKGNNIFDEPLDQISRIPAIRWIV